MNGCSIENREGRRAKESETCRVSVEDPWPDTGAVICPATFIDRVPSFDKLEVGLAGIPDERPRLPPLERISVPLLAGGKPKVESAG